MAELQPNSGPKLSDTERVRQAVEGNSPDESQGKDDAAGEDDDDSPGDDAANGDDAGDDSADDSADDDADGDDADADEDADEDADDDPKPNDQPKDRRFTQFAGDGKDETYISNLEKGYENSSKEAIRLNQELSQATGRVEAIMRAAATDPDLAAKLNAAIKGDGSDAGGSGTDGNSPNAAENPFVKNLQSEWQEKSEKEIATFIEANPEVATDPKISADVKHWMNVFSNDAYNRTGRLMSGGEAMALAYKHLGLENKLEKQNLADGAKKHAAPARQRGKAKKATSQKPAFSDAQIAMAKSMGKDLAWLEKNAK